MMPMWAVVAMWLVWLAGLAIQVRQRHRPLVVVAVPIVVARHLAADRHPRRGVPRLDRVIGRDDRTGHVTSIGALAVRLDLSWPRSSIGCLRSGRTRSAVLDEFAAWAADGGRPLYPHQEEAALALAAGDHVVLATPTGSGKSLVAVAGILLARNDGRRAVWTAPIKALVAEKFFELVDLLGAEHVGLATGDAAINAGAPVLVCTAEVLANQALMTGPASDVGFACLDEFHYYGDADRGWAWQVPLLELTRCQFLLASATLGDMSAISADLQERSGRRGDRR